MGKQKPGGITWCEKTWNPLRGCTRVSEGCRNCYAERTAGRGLQPGGPFVGFALPTADGPRWTGKVELMEHLLHQPASWRVPSTIFVNSMSDTFIEGPDQDQWKFTHQIYCSMLNARRHLFLVLSKRARRMLNFCHRWNIGVDPSIAIQTMDHIWNGVSVENQPAADDRIQLLLDTPCAHRFLSIEPLIGRVTLKPEWLGPGKVEWVIVGGESGPGARPMHPDWVRDIRTACEATGVKFHFKQWGEWLPGTQYTAELARRDPPEQTIFDCVDWEDGEWQKRGGGWTDDLSDAAMYRVGKKAAGRLLDDMTHDWMPKPEGAQL